MPILDLIIYPNPLLREVCIEVSNFGDSLKKLASDMADTMKKNLGIGLAAPQVGVLDRIIVIGVPGKKTLFLVNPEYDVIGNDYASMEEGCLSLPDVRRKVSRPSKIYVKSKNIDGSEQAFSAKGLLSVVIQHEIDHLNGILIIDKL